MKLQEILEIPFNYYQNLNSQGKILFNIGFCGGIAFAGLAAFNYFTENRGVEYPIAMSLIWSSGHCLCGRFSEYRKDRTPSV